MVLTGSTQGLAIVPGRTRPPYEDRQVGFAPPNGVGLYSGKFRQISFVSSRQARGLSVLPKDTGTVWRQARASAENASQ